MPAGCTCTSRDAWRVSARKCNYSAFNGYVRAESDYSQVVCEREEGGCGGTWRTKAAYVDTLKDSARHGRAAHDRRRVKEREREARTVSSYRRAEERPVLVCSICGHPGGPLRGALRPSGEPGRLRHRSCTSEKAA